jgi:hypothetical protein
MNAKDLRETCPACGFPLGFEPWREHSAADEIWPSCGTQFGYDDSAGGDLLKRDTIYQAWRQRWVARGMPWTRASVEGRPCGWDP